MFTLNKCKSMNVCRAKMYANPSNPFNTMLSWTLDLTCITFNALLLLCTVLYFRSIWELSIVLEYVLTLRFPTDRELADNPVFGLGTRWKVKTQRTRPERPVLTPHSRSRPRSPCPGRAGSGSDTQETVMIDKNSKIKQKQKTVCSIARPRLHFEGQYKYW